MDQQAIEEMRRASGRPRPYRGSSDQQYWTPSQVRLFQAVETASGVGRDELHAATRGRHNVAVARQTGMYLARIALGMTLSSAGRLFGRDRTTASHACRVIEDLRDDPGFDALLHEMEAFVVRPDSPSGRTHQ